MNTIKEQLDQVEEIEIQLGLLYANAASSNVRFYLLGAIEYTEGLIRELRAAYEAEQKEQQ